MAPPEPTSELPLGVLGRYAPDSADPSDLCFGLYVRIGAELVFVDIREDKLLEQRKLRALALFNQSEELEASLKSFLRKNPEYAPRSLAYIGLHAKNLEQGEVFWDPSGYTILRGTTFELE